MRRVSDTMSPLRKRPHSRVVLQRHLWSYSRGTTCRRRIRLRDDQRPRLPAVTCSADRSAVGTVGGHQSKTKERVVGAESGVDSPLSACAFSSVASYDISHASHTR